MQGGLALAALYSIMFLLRDAGTYGLITTCGSTSTLPVVSVIVYL
jgi:hypothetical protein